MRCSRAGRLVVPTLAAHVGAGTLLIVGAARSQTPPPSAPPGAASSLPPLPGPVSPGEPPLPPPSPPPSAAAPANSAQALPALPPLTPMPLPGGAKAPAPSPPTAPPPREAAPPARAPSPPSPSATAPTRSAPAGALPTAPTAPTTSASADAAIEGELAIESGRPASDGTEQALRDRSLHEGPTPFGPIGTLHVASALTGAPRTFRVALFGDWFKSSSFLCTPSFPCPATSDQHSHVGGSAVVSATPIEGFEAYLATRVYASSNDQARPALLQVLGDSILGAKYARPLGGGLVNLGGNAELALVNGAGGIGLSGAGTSFRLRALSTFALDATESKTPVRFHLSLGYLFDNSGKVVSSVEEERSARVGKRQQINRIERYGLGVNKVDRFEIGASAEGLLLEDKLRPFLEYTVHVPYNRQGYECPKPTATSDQCLGEQGYSSIPSKISLGGRALPFDGALRGLSFLLGLDIGLSATSNFIHEVAPQAPYTVWLGVGLAADATERAPRVVERRVAPKASGPVLVHVRGFVHEQGAQTPIPNAIVRYVGASLPPLSTGDDGVFGDDVPPGTYQLAIKAEGYKDGVCGGTATAPADKGAAPGTHAPAASNAGLALDCALEALPRAGAAVVTILDADGQLPIPSIEVVVEDSGGGNQHRVVTDASGVVRVDALPPGTYSAKIDAEGYFSTRQPIEVRPREDATIRVALRARPKDRLVSVEKNELRIKQQVHFATDKATILPDSTALLEEVADVLIHTPRVKRIQVQGHTDNVGTREHNLALSAARAEAVRSFLEKAGVASARLETKGFGDTKPIAPNINEAGRARNRRVQFVIVDQDPAAETEKPAARPEPAKKKK